MRPRIICHMLTSINGKITGDYMETKSAEIVGSEYERINQNYNSQAWLCGRVTTDENFTFYNKPDLDENAPQVPEGDFLAVKDAPMYYISVDTSGKIGWKSNVLIYEDRPKAHVVEALTEKASNSYKAFLRKMAISYVIVGKEELDCALLVKKLYDLFGIKTLMLSGGGYINGSFLNAGLIDEISILIAPVTGSYSNTVSLFEYGNYLTKKAPVEFKLENVEKLEGDGIWLRYVTQK